MKKALILLLALLMALGGCALAETAEDNPLAEYALTSGVPVEINLNGDGTIETLTYTAETDETLGGEFARIEIGTARGTTVGWNTQTLFMTSAYAVDIDGDGAVEVFICGDWASSDYATYCLHYLDHGDHGEIELLSFANADRGDENEGYNLYGYGYIQSVDGNELVLCGSQDVLGTYFGTRTFALVDGVFEFADDGLWRFDTSDVEWEYRALTPTQDIAATFIDGDAQTEGAIEAGTRFVITASDKTSVAWFRTEDGREGFFSIAPDTERGWGMKVNGVSEEELFEMVPYAD